MPVFHLSMDTIDKLKRKFLAFHHSRLTVHKLIPDYIADYRQFSGSREDRKEFLDRQFSNRVPDFSHLIFDDEEILWHVSDIATLLGRNQSSISRTLSHIEHSEGWCSRLLAIRRPAKSANGNSIFVYHKEIFDLIIDWYEEEYLLRFSHPRWGSKVNAPDEHEIRRFWAYLKLNYETINRFSQDALELPDVPPMSWKDIISIIWRKVFTLKVSTVASLVFAVCFELARRFFGLHLWFAVPPALVVLLSAFLIHRRKLNPDLLSDIGAGAFFCLLLCLSASLSSDKLSPTREDNHDVLTQSMNLTPTLGGQDNSLNVAINVRNYGSSGTMDRLKSSSTGCPLT